MNKRLGFVLALSLALLPVAASATEPDRNTSLFDRTHQAIDRNMQTGNDRSPPLGQGPGEQTGLGGSSHYGGAYAPGSQSTDGMNERNQ
jgi:hypothetical protein